MRRLIVSQLRHRPGRSGALALAILVAAVSFTLLTASASTSALHVRGTLKSSFRPAYDILVRPRNVETSLERNEGLVRPNFLAGIYGGISFKQWHEIEQTRGVTVAAPIANVGFMMPFGNLTIPITGLVDKKPFQLYRIKETWLANGGISRYPGPTLYVYYTPRDRFVNIGGDYGMFMETGPGVKSPEPSCGSFANTSGASPVSPFPPLDSLSSLACYPTATYRVKATNYVGTVNSWIPPNGKFVGTRVGLYFPVYISAIDPEQEARLVHLDKAVVNGRYFKPGEGLTPFTTAGGGTDVHLGGPIHFQLAPVLASSRTYVGESLRLTIQRLALPPGTNVPRDLATGACRKPGVLPCPTVPPPPGAGYRNAREFTTALPGQTIATRTVPAGSFYRQLLDERRKPFPPGVISTDIYWTATPARYQRLGPDHLAPVPVRNPKTIWFSNFSGYDQPPRENLDTQFRRLHGRASQNDFVKGKAEWNPLQIIGEFDPNKLPNYSPLTKVPLDTYYPPELFPASAASKRALHDQPLLPTQNVGGYIEQPPLLLTTMQGLRAFLNPVFWVGQGALADKPAVPKAQQRAPISAIRVKVSGVTGPDPLSLERIRVVAQKIHAETGLAVDITAGSSPHPVLISLPKGKFGRPPLLVSEGWSKKGVTVSFLRALDRKDLALFALILIVCAFFLGNGAFAAVRTRRAELGALLTIGWSPNEIFRAVLGELAMVGLVAGVAGSGLAAALVAGFSLHFPLLRTLYVIPIALGLALLAGLLPAWRAARGRPLDAILPPVTSRISGRRVRGVLGMAFINLGRLPGRTLVGAAGLLLGVAALTVLVAIEQGFHGTLVGTVLGNVLSVQVRGADFVALGLTLALSALSAADVLYLNLREREAELVTLQTFGWSDGETRLLVALEALLLALGASIVGAVVGILVGGPLLGVGVAGLVEGAVISTAAAVCAAFLSSLLPLLRLRRLAAPEVLAAE